MKGETKENDESVKQLFEDASREFEEAVVCQLSLLISPLYPRLREKEVQDRRGEKLDVI